MRMDSNQQTLRVAELPPKTRVEDVKNFFDDRIQRKHGRQIVESVGPICTHSSRITKRTTVSFSSAKTAQKAKDLEETSRRLYATDGGSGTITLDASFTDLTTLHSSDNPVMGKPDIDIVALHGLTGHAWNSFTASASVNQDAGRTKEINWLRDILPRLLENNTQQKIYPRVMTYGYNADVWMTKSVQEIDVPVDNLLSYLATERTEDPERPLFFVGHSLGGIVIKQAIVALADEALVHSIQEPPASTKRYNFPVKGCMLFGVPNRGSDVANTASGILKLLNTVFNVNRNMVQDLEKKSQRLANIASQFRQVRHEHNIPVISFFEQQKYGSGLGLIVDKDSAVVEYPGSPRPFGVDRNHKEMAKFSSDDAHALEPAIFFLAQVARDALMVRHRRNASMNRPSTPAPRRPDIEDKFSILDSYDTVFLVDDSPSMAGERWDLVKNILDYSTALATTYDPDGIDVHFLNNKSANQDNIKDQAVAVDIHQRIALRGNTPLYDQLSRHITGYLKKFQDRGDDFNFKGYNLIILTDGEPNKMWEDPDEVSDPEDAKVTSAAFRLIRKKIVSVARALDDNEAERGQVGIQFCQIGTDPKARDFFDYLDNRLKGKWKLQRDMVDTITCFSEADLTDKFFEKLLLGAIDKAVDHEVIETPSSASYPTNGHDQLPHYTPPPPTQQSTFPHGSDEKFAPRPENVRYDGSARGYPNDRTAALYNLPAAQSSPSISQHIQGYPPQTEQRNQQPAASLLRQSTLPQTSAELPNQPAARSRSFGKAKWGWKPSS